MADRPDVALVPLNASHADRTRAWANDPEVSRLMNREKSVTEGEHEIWMASVLAREDCLFFAVERQPGAEHVGNVWLWNIDRRHRQAELRVVIGEVEARDGGLGTRAIRLLARHAFEAQQLHRVYAYVLAFNQRGRRAFEKAGFDCEGTLRDAQWTGAGFSDVYLMAAIAGRGDA